MSSGARARFAQIVLPLVDEAYRLARWLTGSAADAEDVIQEACLKAFNSIDLFVEGNARAWFLTIVRNASYSWMRKHRSNALTFIEDLDPASRTAMEMGGIHTPAPQSPEDMLITKNETARMAAAIESLPLHTREVIVLREYHGLSYREIADMIGIPMGTVMSRLSSGRKSLAMLRKEERP